MTDPIAVPETISMIESIPTSVLVYEDVVIGEGD